MTTASLIGLSRLRLKTDGHGVTTLVAFHGCPLHCRYCLNPQCLRSNSKTLNLSPEEVFKVLKKDELYYLATKGGATFGGGEPLLKYDFIKKVLDLGAKEWHTTIETSLNVPLDNLESLFQYIDEYIVDVKDMDSSTYLRYTGKDNSNVIRNLKWLIKKGKADNIVCRIPLIPEFNTQEAQEQSRNILQGWGVKRFDLFSYITNKHKRQI